VAVGFPGVVRHGMIETAQNLHEKWRGFRLAQKLESKLHKPVRFVNDADLQGFGAISGRGVELVITLGTGFGSALFIDGQLVPNLEIALYPLGRRTYQAMLGDAARRKVGNKRWNRRLSRAIEALYLVFNLTIFTSAAVTAKKSNSICHQAFGSFPTWWPCMVEFKCGSEASLTPFLL